MSYETRDDILKPISRIFVLRWYTIVRLEVDPVLQNLLIMIRKFTQRINYANNLKNECGYQSNINRSLQTFNDIRFQCRRKIQHESESRNCTRAQVGNWEAGRQFSLLAWKNDAPCFCLLPFAQSGTEKRMPSYLDTRLFF